MLMWSKRSINVILEERDLKEGEQHDLHMYLESSSGLQIQS